jgi:hypothetical protein
MIYIMLLNIRQNYKNKKKVIAEDLWSAVVAKISYYKLPKSLKHEINKIIYKLFEYNTNHAAAAARGRLHVRFCIRFSIRFHANRIEIRFSVRHEKQASTHTHIRFCIRFRIRFCPILCHKLGTVKGSSTRTFSNPIICPIANRMPGYSLSNFPSDTITNQPISSKLLTNLFFGKQ